MKITSIAFSNLLLLMTPWALLAQITLKGKVHNGDFDQVSQVKVRINDTYEAMSDAQGSFQINIPEKVFKPFRVSIEKKEHLLKGWRYQNGNLVVMLHETYTLTGRVLEVGKDPVEDMQILLVGLQGMKPLHTDQNGEFSLVLPKNFDIEEKSFLIAFDSDKRKNKINYKVKKQGDTLINFLVEFVPREVQKVRIRDGENRPVPQLSLKIDSRRFVSDTKGELALPKSVSDRSVFWADLHNITHFYYDSDKLSLTIFVNALGEGEVSKPREIHYLDDRFIRNQ